MTEGTNSPREGRVVITPRKAYGRKRSGGYLGHHKRPPWEPRVEPWMIRLCEQLAGPEWRTVAEICAILGKLPNVFGSNISRIQKANPPGFAIRRSLSPTGDPLLSSTRDPNVQWSIEHCGKRGKTRGGNGGAGLKKFQAVYYQIERTSNDASE